MGGKVWSDREEKHFWRSAMSYSAKRVGVDRAKPERSWAELAASMQRALGEHARRIYTGTMLFEHYFQNIESQRRSPNAALYVREYLRKAGSFHDPLARLSTANRRRIIRANNPVNAPIATLNPASGLASLFEDDSSPCTQQAAEAVIGFFPLPELQTAMNPLEPTGKLTEELLEDIDLDETEAE